MTLAHIIGTALLVIVSVGPALAVIITRGYSNCPGINPTAARPSDTDTTTTTDTRR